MGRINKSSKKETSTKKSTELVQSDAKSKKNHNKLTSLNKTLDFKPINKKKQNKTAISTKLKKNEELKSNLLKQIHSSNKLSTDTAGNQHAADELNFVKRPQTPSRLTNKMLKSIINVANTSLKKEDTKVPKIKKSLKKSVKSKIKKQAWIKNIEQIKSQIKEKEAKEKREKTAIVGDVKPMIDSLITTTGTKTFNKSKNKNATKNIDDLFELTTIKEEKETALAAIKSTRLENREKNRIKEMSKSIPKQSIRMKKSQEDLALFGELSMHKEFVSNPLEIIKKHIK